MIFARDKSQMCNNLLQYAHVYAWGREHGRKVLSMRFSYKYPYFHIQQTSLTSFPLYVIAKALAAIKLLPTASFKHAECDREALELKMLRCRHIVVSGWYVRYYDLFLKYRQEICELFAIDEQYSMPVKQKMQAAEGSANRIVRLGVHIRRGDYSVWCNGKFFYDDDIYARHINKFAKMHDKSVVHVYLSSNDSSVTEEHFQQLCPRVSVHNLNGSAPEDLFMLSECDFIIGPPSTFSLVAAMYRDVPLYRMDTSNVDDMSESTFRLFDYWFRRII